MAKQVTLNNSFFQKLDDIEDDLTEHLEGVLDNLAVAAVNFSPVDTGAYVTSFSMLPKGSGGGRSRSSKRKPRKQNPEAMRDQGLTQLRQDIKSLDLRKISGATLRNRSPHANSVEDGGPSWRRAGYHVFRKLRNIYG